MQGRTGRPAAEDDLQDRPIGEVKDWAGRWKALTEFVNIELDVERSACISTGVAVYKKIERWTFSVPLT
jgi:hypothetical protein